MYGKYSLRVKMRIDNTVEFTYKRDQGDLVVYAHNKLEALATIRQFGFLVTEPDRIRQTGVSVTEHIKRSQIK